MALVAERLPGVGKTSTRTVSPPGRVSCLNASERSRAMSWPVHTDPHQGAVRRQLGEEHWP
ncbi:hypothetical protein ACFFX0_25265 [Citricoccus parietis]|uniref:Uncharacterized protein n=1 Tax=Citricoccus parietis TaxID=592307 RepID=A0ABV5G7B6_9MICC